MSQYEQLIHDFNDYLKIVSNAENLEIEIKDKVKFYLDEILKSTKGNRDFYTSVFLRDGETVFLNVMDGINYLVKLNSDFSTDEEFANHLLFVNQIFDFYIDIIENKNGYEITNGNFGLYFNFLNKILDLIYTKDEYLEKNDVIVFNGSYLKNKRLVSFLDDFFLKNSLMKNNYFKEEFEGYHDTKYLSINNKNLFIDNILIKYLKVRETVSSVKGLLFMPQFINTLINSQIINNENLLSFIIKQTNELTCFSENGFSENGKYKYATKEEIKINENKHINENICDTLKFNNSSRQTYLVNEHILLEKNGFVNIYNSFVNNIDFNHLFENIKDLNLLKKIKYTYFNKDDKKYFESSLYNLYFELDVNGKVNEDKDYLTKNEMTFYNNYLFEGLVNINENNFVNNFSKIIENISSSYDYKKINSELFIKLFTDYMFLLIYEKIEDKEIKNNILNDIRKENFENRIDYINFVKDVKLEKKVIDIFSMDDSRYSFLYGLLTRESSISMTSKNHYLSNTIYNIFKNINLQLTKNVYIRLFGDLTFSNNDYFQFSDSKYGNGQFSISIFDIISGNIENYVTYGTERSSNIYQSKSELMGVYLVNILNSYLSTDDKLEKQNLKETIIELSQKYEFNYDDILDYLNININKSIFNKNNELTNSLISFKDCLNDVYNIKQSKTRKMKV